jgi:hypothetical protein
MLAINRDKSADRYKYDRVERFEQCLNGYAPGCKRRHGRS